MTGKIMVVMTTFYANEDDIRFELALEACREIVRHNLRAIIVDASPSEGIRQAMIREGTSSSTGIKHVRVVVQTYPGKKGGALREGITIVSKEEEANIDVIAFQEPEKVDMIKDWPAIAERIINDDSVDICAPKRADSSFREYYPIEQYHSENFGNLHFNALAAEAGGSFPTDGIDWLIGPMAFRSCRAGWWSGDIYEGDLWDMQLVPLIYATRWLGAKVISHEVDFKLDKSMKDEEEGVAKWSEKRLFQLNFLFDKLGQALKETTNPIKEK